MGPLLWTTKSLRHLAGELTAQGHPVGPDTVADLLKYYSRRSCDVVSGWSLTGHDAGCDG
jgi:Rhodopirellula transposase DDE domain